MTKVLRLLALFLLVLAARPAASSSCRALVTCYSLPQYYFADPSWQYSHQCCDIYDDTTVWNVFIDSADNWYLVRYYDPNAIPP